MTQVAQNTTNPATLRQFKINTAQADLDDLRRRIATTRWPQRETVTDDSQGVPLAVTQQLASYWASGYDWRKCEAKLNALPQFMTEIDGLQISVFPGEIYQAPRSWTATVYHNIIYYNANVAKGGHFAAWEQPQLFSEELRRAFKSLR